MFAVGNAFCFAAQGFGVDGNKIIKIANQGYTRANIALPGFVGGPCLEKDAYILTNNMTNSASRDFILSARRFNESVEDIVVKWVEEEFQKDETIAVSGMAFKGIPDTSDLRGSNSVNIVMKLKEKGFKLHIHDYVANRQEMEGLGLGTVFDDIYDAIDNTSLLLILNNNIRYKELDLKLIQKSKAAFCILDIWNSCKNIPLTDKIKIYNIGNMFL
jgi:UDP-N-acetyl-D-mannosaminuronic acid dehydrogenase